MRTVINKCPFCGGSVAIHAKVSVCMEIYENGYADIITETDELAMQVKDAVRSSLSYNCVCDDCGAQHLRAKLLPSGNYEISFDS